MESITLQARDIGSETPITIRVHSLRTTRFRVTDRAGEPIADALVEMVRSHVAYPVRAFDRDPTSLRRDGSWSDQLELVGEGKTDAQGFVDIEGGPWQDGSSTLLVTGESLAPAIISPADTRSRNGVHEATIDRGGHVEGKFANFDTLDLSGDPVRITLESPNGLVTRMPPDRFGSAYQADANGGFVVGQVPPGEWGFVLQQGSNRRELTRFVVRDGEKQKIEVDAKTFAPDQGSLRGSIRINGRVEHILIAEPSAQTDDLGNFGPIHMAIGRRSLDIAVRIGSGFRKTLRNIAEFDVLRNTTHRLDLDVRVVQMHLKLVTADGDTVPYERVHLLCGDDVHYSGLAEVDGRVGFHLQKGKRYDVALEAVGETAIEGWHERHSGSDRWVRLGPIVAVEGAATLVVR